MTIYLNIISLIFNSCYGCSSKKVKTYCSNSYNKTITIVTTCVSFLIKPLILYSSIYHSYNHVDSITTVMAF